MNHTLFYRIDLNNGNFGTNMNTAMQQTSRLDSIFNKLGATMAAAFTIDKAKQLVDDTTQVAVRMQGLDNIIKFASKSQADYAQNQTFINKTIKEFALPAEEAKQGFANMLAAFKSMPQGAEKAKQVFIGLSTAATVLHMNNQQVAQSTKALTDMLGKGTVQAEELKGQLGDAGIKDAIGIAARAMGQSIPELLKNMEKGLVISSEFVPKFAQQLQKEFGSGMKVALQGYQASMNTANNTILQQKNIIGEQLMPVKLKLLEVEGKTLQIISNILDFYIQNNNTINALVGTYVAYKTAAMASLAITKLKTFFIAANTTSVTANSLATALNTQFSTANNATTAIGTTALARNTVGLIANTAATNTATAAQWSLNAAIAANPIGALIIALGTAYTLYSMVADQAERLAQIQDEARQRTIQAQGDLERQQLNSLAQSLEKKGLAPKGKGLEKAVQLETEYYNNQLAQKEKLAATATGDTRKKLLYEIDIIKANKAAIDEVNEKKLGNNNQNIAATQNITGGVAPKNHSNTSSTASGKSIIVNIQNLVKEINVKSVNEVNQKEFDNQITNALIRAVRDFETTQ